MIWVCTVCQCPSPGSADNPLYTALWHHSDKNSLTINNRYLEFIIVRLITLVNDNHVDNYLKEILASVYYGSNIRPKNHNSDLKLQILILHHSALSCSSFHYLWLSTHKYSALCVNFVMMSEISPVTTTTTSDMHISFLCINWINILFWVYPIMSVYHIYHV